MAARSHGEEGKVTFEADDPNNDLEGGERGASRGRRISRRLSSGSLSIRSLSATRRDQGPDLSLPVAYRTVYVSVFICRMVSTNG